jgi:uncharacterized lipoprotein YmbA
MAIRLSLFRVFLLGFLLAAVGCAGSPIARFYTLSPVVATAEVKSPQEAPGKDLAVGIGPIRIPEYLLRKEIVTRMDENRIDLAEYDLWGGTLQDDFLRILLENLNLLLGGSRVSLIPWPGIGAVDYRVGVEVSRFDGSLGREVVLIATWIIRESKGNTIARIRTSRIQESAGGQTYEGLVGGMSRALARLSREISEEIKTLPR